MPTLEDFWTTQRTAATIRGGKKCADCGNVATGHLCWACNVKAKRAPLDPCFDCNAPLHRRSTPKDDRVPGSKSYGSLGRCTGCDQIHRTGNRRGAGMSPCVDCSKPARGERCRQCDTVHRAAIRAAMPPKEKTPRVRTHKAAVSLAERFPVPVPSDDTSPLTEDELKQAVCAQVDTEIFFAELGQGYTEAKTVCHGCPIKARCLAANMDEEYGVFGAASPPERKKLRRETREEAVA